MPRGEWIEIRKTTEKKGTKNATMKIRNAIFLLRGFEGEGATVEVSN